MLKYMANNPIEEFRLHQKKFCREMKKPTCVRVCYNESRHKEGKLNLLQVPHFRPKEERNYRRTKLGVDTVFEIVVLRTIHIRE